MMYLVDKRLVELIENATEKALIELFKNNEHYYYISLITTGEGLCPFISAWSHEALEKASNGDEDERYYLKWAYDESPYFDYGGQFFGEVKKEFENRKEFLTEQNYLDEVEIRINSMEQALMNLDMKGLFGKGEKRKSIVVNAEFMPPDYTNTLRAQRINPPEAIVEWLEEIAEME
mgnify:CR=1 FL=1